MAHVKRRYDNPTKPKRCGLVIPTGQATFVLCRGRVYRRGMCVKHYEAWRELKATHKPAVKGVDKPLPYTPKVKKVRDIQERKLRQGISVDTQMELIRNAQRRGVTKYA